jgi:hypothetical protein
MAILAGSLARDHVGLLNLRWTLIERAPGQSPSRIGAR